MSDPLPTEERFNDVEPFLDSDGTVICEIETDGISPGRAGQLWVGNTWVTVAQARELRAWLDRVIPAPGGLPGD